MAEIQDVQENLESAIDFADNSVVISELQNVLKLLEENKYTAAIDLLNQIITVPSGTNKEASSRIYEARDQLIQLTPSRN